MREPRLPARTLRASGGIVRLQIRRAALADILYLALGLGAFALFGLYAALLRKV
jgi:hypothetical protein